MWFSRLFARRSSLPPDVLDAEKVMEVAGEQKFYIANGRSWYHGGGNPKLYEHHYLRVHLGRVVSGYGDWGGGFDRTSTGPVNVIIDKDLNIIEMEFDDFGGYNTASSRAIRQGCEKVFGGREYKRLHVRPNSSLDIKLKEAFASEETTPFMFGFQEYIRDCCED